jgi:hypothetical protein
MRKISKKKCFDFSEGRLKRKPQKQIRKLAYVKVIF